MNKSLFTRSRRNFLNLAAGITSFFAFKNIIPDTALAQPVRPPDPEKQITKPIPSTGEMIPVIGMGTWITFNVGPDTTLRNQRTEVLKEFFRYGGGMIDCSPMYGTSADVLGYALERINNTPNLFPASKIWASSTADGPSQMQTQKQHWGINSFDLMQVHNLRNWRGHLETLRRYKEEGKIRYIGVTTSHGRRHEDLEQVLKTQDIDFVQLTYNILDREAEDRLIPIAKDKGIAVIANRPYRRKDLMYKFQSRPLPGWAEEDADARNWAEFLLKFIVSHPGVTCTIPATTQVPHMRENMGAAYGYLPDDKTRARMIEYVESL